MPDGQVIQRVPIPSPLGQEAVHQRDEAAVVRRFQQVGHFMNDDVFETFSWFFCQIRVEPDACGAGATATPFGFHPLHKKPLHLHAHARLPFRDYQRAAILSWERYHSSRMACFFSSPVAGEQFLHNALFDVAFFGDKLLQGFDKGIRIAQNISDGFLLGFGGGGGDKQLFDVVKKQVSLSALI